MYFKRRQHLLRFYFSECKSSTKSGQRCSDLILIVRIYTPQEWLAGSIDFVAVDANGALILFDWKRSKSLRSKYSNHFSCMLPPLQHIEDCQGWHYRLQLNAYRYLLEKYYGKYVASMHVVCTHPDNVDDAFVDDVPALNREIESMMEIQRARVRETASLARSDELSLDPLGGADDDDDGPSLNRCLEMEEEFMNESLAANTAPGAASSSSVAPPIQAPLPSAVEQNLPCASEDQTYASPERAVAAHISMEGDAEIAGVDTGSSTLQQVKKRRFLPGASTSAAEFDLFFRTQRDAAIAALLNKRPAKAEQKASIVHRTSELFKQTKASYAAWDVDLHKLAVGALAMYRLRLSDMFMREQVFLLWIIEGSDFIRAHGGSCYMYHDDGAFQTYKGIPPESTFGRVKEYLIRLEGLFCLIPKDTRRTDDDLLQAIESVRTSRTTLAGLFGACEEAAIFNVGGRQRTKRAKGDGNGGGEDDGSDHEKVLIHWNILVAEALSKVGMQLQKALLEEKIISFIVEWCETPISRKAGVAYTDTCVMYDKDGEILQHVARSPDNDIYLRIPHPLLDPVLQSAEKAYFTFIAQTFWANLPVYECMQAAIALVKRGENIDRCFIGISPGGVGQSLYSSLLDAMFGHLHAFFDPNIWYNDEEMRKQIANMEGCVILTAQEAPETNRKLREDLYKKTMSADGIAGRKPYGMVTRMLELVGWKRLEANRMLEFAGVTEHNFNSIYRRSLVWKPKARFLDGDYLAANYPDHAKDGIFAKDPRLKNLLVSGPLVAAGLRDQHGFELRHARQECRDCIERYAALGGDSGLTEDLLRSASGLRVRDRTECERPADAELHAIPPDTQDCDQTQKDKLFQVLEEIVNDALVKHRDLCTPAMFKYVTLPKTVPNMDRATMWKSLIEEGLLTPVDIKGKKGSEWARPVITGRKDFRSTLHVAIPNANPSFPEVYNIQQLDTYLNGNSSRQVNARIVEEFLCESSKQIQVRKKGKVSIVNKSKAEQLVQSFEKFKAGETLAHVFLEKYLGTTASKRRRLAKKNSGSDVQPTPDATMVRTTVSYRYTLDTLIRTRRIAEQGAQNTSRRVLKQIVPHTLDFDIENCMFTILDQLVDIIEIQMPEHLRTTLTSCAKQRTQVGME